MSQPGRFDARTYPRLSNSSGLRTPTVISLDAPTLHKVGHIEVERKKDIEALARILAVDLELQVACGGGNMDQNAAALPGRRHRKIAAKPPHLDLLPRLPDNSGSSGKSPPCPLRSAKLLTFQGEGTLSGVFSQPSATGGVNSGAGSTPFFKISRKRYRLELPRTGETDVIAQRLFRSLHPGLRGGEFVIELDASPGHSASGENKQARCNQGQNRTALKSAKEEDNLMNDT